jgi:hypothetical protein
MSHRHSPLWPDHRIKPPYGAVEIDGGHPLAVGLTAAWVLNAGAGVVDSVPGVPRMPTTTNPIWGAFGGYYSEGTTIGNLTNVSTGITAAPYTLTVRIRATAIPTVNRKIITHLYSPAGYIYGAFGIDSTTGYVHIVAERIGSFELAVSSSINICDKLPHVLTGVFASDTDKRLYVDGVLAATITTSVVIYAGGPYVVCFGSIGNGSSSGFTGSIEMAAIHKTALSADRIALLASDPYCFLREVHPRTYGFLGAAGGVQAYTQSLAGSVVTFGALARGLGTFRAGASVSSGALTRAVATPRAGSIAPTGDAVKAVATPRVGAVAASGAVGRAVGRGLAGVVAPVGSALKQVGRAFAGAVAPTGLLTIVRVALLALSGAVTASGEIAQRVGRNLTGVVVPTGAALKLIGRGLAGAAASSGALLRQAGKVAAGAVTTSGAVGLGRAVLLTVSGTASATGALLKSVGRVFVGSVATSGSRLVAVGRMLTGAVVPAGAVTKHVLRSLAGDIVATGTTFFQRMLLLGGAVLAAGTLTKRVAAGWIGTVLPAGAVAKLIGRAFGGVVTVLGAVANVGVSLVAGVLSLINVGLHSATLCGQTVRSSRLIQGALRAARLINERIDS